jgi:branched-chain amino acid transport system substrate-binding protein
MRLATGFRALSAMALLVLPVATPLAAQTVRGVTAAEIKIGQTMPYSGPLSALGSLGKGEVGHFKMVNERAGINGARSI